MTNELKMKIADFEKELRAKDDYIKVLSRKSNNPNEKPFNKFRNTLDIDELKFLKTAENCGNLFTNQKDSLSTKASNFQGTSYELPLSINDSSKNLLHIKSIQRNLGNEFLNYPLQKSKLSNSNMNLCNNNIFVNFPSESMFKDIRNFECNKCKMTLNPNDFPKHIKEVILTYCTKLNTVSNYSGEKSFKQSKEKWMESEVKNKIGKK